MAENYCIKEGYVALTERRTFDGDTDGSYWNADRLALSRRYQYYVYALARRLIRSEGRKSLMDVGCGPALKIRELLAPHCGDFVLVDQPTIEGIVKQNVDCPFVAADLDTIEIDLGRTFDVVVCADVVEHLLDPARCLAFIRRHLGERSVALISTPERYHLYGKRCMRSMHPDHVREWNADEFGRYLASQGFRVRRTLLYPQMRIGAAEFGLSRLLSPLVRTRAWSSCQVAVCQKR